MHDTPTPQPPRILIASHHAEAGLALKELGEKNGYTVLRCFSAMQTLERARATRPDLIVLDESLVDADPLETSRALRADPLVGPSTPILLVTTGQAVPIDHQRALRAGVWEFLAHPFNPDEAAARLHTYVLHKLEVGRAQRAQAVQDDAGLYTTQGLALRAQELTLQAFHHGAALACVALAPLADSAGDGAAAVQLVERVLRASGRRSDAIGRIGPSEFAIVAPGTDGVGAVMLAQRVARAVRAASGDEPPALRAGYDAVGNTRYTPVEPKNLLARATSALRLAKGEAAANWIRAFDAA
jgi:PleD family two-component response regulator